PRAPAAASLRNPDTCFVARETPAAVELAAHVPHAGRRPEYRDVGLTIAVEIRGTHRVAAQAPVGGRVGAVNRRLDDPSSQRGAEDGEVRLAVAVEIRRRRHVARETPVE